MASKHLPSLYPLFLHVSLNSRDSQPLWGSEDDDDDAEDDTFWRSDPAAERNLQKKNVVNSEIMEIDSDQNKNCLEHWDDYWNWKFVGRTLDGHRWEPSTAK